MPKLVSETLVMTIDVGQFGHCKTSEQFHCEVARKPQQTSSCGSSFCPNLQRWSMLRVSSAASGAEVAVLDVDKLDATMPGIGSSILALKKYLSHQVGCSRFRQRILNGNAGELFDDQEICAPVDLQLVILDFWPFEEHEDAKFVSACEQNELAQLEEILQRPQNPDARDRDGWPALHFAAQVGTASCMELLLESRSDLEIRATEDGSTALHCAVFNGNPKVVKVLLDAGADRNSALQGGKTALHLAIQGGHLEIVQLLLDAGAEKNGFSLSPLILAAEDGNLEMVQLLLDAGADKNSATEMASRLCTLQFSWLTCK
jgi:ankyrin repeat protein